MWQKELAAKNLIFLSNVSAHRQFSAAPCLHLKPNTHTHTPPHTVFPPRQRPVSSGVWKRQSGTLPTPAYRQPQRKVPGETGPWAIPWKSICPPTWMRTLWWPGGIGFQKQSTKRREHFAALQWRRIKNQGCFSSCGFNFISSVRYSAKCTKHVKQFAWNKLYEQSSYL